MVFLILLATATIAYLVWRISDQMPDLTFRLSEIQRDVAELRRELGAARETSGDDSDDTGSTGS